MTAIAILSAMFLAADCSATVSPRDGARSAPAERPSILEVLGLSAPAPRSAPPVEQPPLRLRKEWDARPAPWHPDQPKVRIVVHHTAELVSASTQALSGAESLAAAKAEMRRMQDVHTAPPIRMDDIAYHYVIDWEGRIWEGRPLWAEGAHTWQNNPGSVGVSLMGNFMKQRPTGAQLDALLALCDWLSSRYGISPYKILGHKDMPGNEDNECPGYHLHGEGGPQNPLRRIRLAVLARRQLEKKRL